MLVSFTAKAESLRHWQNVTGLDTFRALRDPEKELYRLFGLGRSLIKGYYHEALRMHGSRAAKIQSGAIVPSRGESEMVMEDPLLLGGDFSVDCHSGNMALVYRLVSVNGPFLVLLLISYKFNFVRSKTSEDRPTLEEILNQ